MVSMFSKALDARCRRYLAIFFLGLVFESIFVPADEDGYSTARSDLKVSQCTCRNRRGYPAAQFVYQESFNVCEIACDSAGNLVSEVPEFETILNGYNRMMKLKVEVCMLCQDAGRMVPNIVTRMTQMSEYFEALQVTVIENDPLDGTVDLLRKWADTLDATGRLRVTVESYKLFASKTTRYAPSHIYDSKEYEVQRETRYGRMSILRSRCLLEVLKRPETQYLIVTDADDDLNHAAFQMDGIAHSFGLQGPTSALRWNSVCANGVTRAKNHVLPHLRLERNHSEPIPSAALEWVFWDSLAYRDKYFTRSSFRVHQRRIHTPYDKPVFVESCFGGLTIYDISSSPDWKHCSYESNIDSDCEHVSFHHCLQRHNWRMLFNPRMMISYNPRASVRHVTSQDVANTQSHLASRAPNQKRGIHGILNT
jgi:hypothetical protein